VDGQSLVPIPKWEADEVVKPYLTARFIGIYRITPTKEVARSGAVRKGNWKLVEDYETGALELYDLSAEYILEKPPM
jgi:hypothetical protein